MKNKRITFLVCYIAFLLVLSAIFIFCVFSAAATAYKNIKKKIPLSINSTNGYGMLVVTVDELTLSVQRMCVCVCSQCN